MKIGAIYGVKWKVPSKQSYSKRREAGNAGAEKVENDETFIKDATKQVDILV